MYNSFSHVLIFSFLPFLFEKFDVTLKPVDQSHIRAASWNEIALVPIGPGFERYSRFVLWAGWRLKSYHATQAECGAHPKRCRIGLTSLSGGRDCSRKKRDTLPSSQAALIVAVLVIRGEITRTTQQDWRRDLWYRDSTLIWTRCFASVARLDEQSESFWCAAWRVRCNPSRICIAPTDEWNFHRWFTRSKVSSIMICVRAPV